MPKLPCNFSRLIGTYSCYLIYSDLGSSCLDCMHGFPASIGNVRVTIYPSLSFGCLLIEVGDQFQMLLQENGRSR